MKLKPLVRALPFAIALAPFAAQANLTVENLDYFGYVKWGNTYTENEGHNDGKGERNTVIRANQGFGNYRLGNEMNWWEAGVKADIWRQDEVHFDFTLYLGSGDAWGDVSTIQAWTAGHGLIASQPNAKIWAGERFYRRHEVHMVDLKYWDTSATGVGIEDIDLGYGKAHIAYFAPNSNHDGRSLHHLDLRLSDITISDAQKMTVGLNYVSANNSSYDNSDITTSGMMFTAKHDSAWSKGSNTFALQYGIDALAGGLMSGEGSSAIKYNTGVESNGSSIRLINHGQVSFSENLEAFYSIAYQDRNLDNDNGEKWFSVGVRPQYSWTPFMATAFEAGYETLDAQNDAGTNDVYKLTVAQIIQAGKGLWARPSIRLYATYSDSSNEWTREGGAFGTAIGASDKGVGEMTYGFNFEAWW